MNADTIKLVRRSSEGIVVEAQGDIDLRYQPQFQRALLKICEEKPSRLVIHMGDVKYMDSSGVGTLVKIAHAVKGYSGKLALVALTPTVRSIFEITTLDRYFTILPTEEEALAL